MLNQLNEGVCNIKTTNQPVIAGIDEAGRGPVVGPMVYGLYVASIDEISNYSDSKQLSPRERENFFARMSSYAYYKVSATYITSRMEAGMSLNEIAREAVVWLLERLVEKCNNVRTVYIDGLGNNEEYKRSLSRLFPLNFIIENKADSTYQVVSGASIVAKVVRDAAVAPLGCGSGYPGDPKTRMWLEGLVKMGYPDSVRYSWATVKGVLPMNRTRKMQKSLKGFYSGPH